MANPEHVAKLKEGADAWNAWRRTTRDKPDLSGADFNGQFLDYYDLRSADFRDTSLHNVSLLGTLCDECSFENAVISDTTFWGSELRKSIFRHATIEFTLFSRCVLDASDFTQASIFGTTFDHVNLSRVNGLDTVELRGNSIGIDTFFRSGGLSEHFLRGADVPEEFIEYASSLVGTSIEYHSCFLSYSSKDHEFARRLYHDLQSRKIRTWWAHEDLKIGDRLRPRIEESIRLYDKLVLVLSASSVVSNWVEAEVESALEREQKERGNVLFPIAIDDAGFNSQEPWAAHIRRTRQIGDFRHDYAIAFDRLVRDLKKSQPPIIMKGG